MSLKSLIDLFIRFSPNSIRKNILRASLHVSNRIRETPGSYIYDIHQRMQLQNILPNIKSRSTYEVALDSIIHKNNKTRIRIVYPSGVSWNCIGSLYHELIQDNSYQTIVITEDYPNYIRVMEEHQCTFIRLNEYDIKRDKPDILILTSYSFTPPELNFEGIRNYVGTILSLFPNIVINEYDNVKHWEYVSRAYKYCAPDYYFFDSLVFNNCKGFIEDGKALRFGSPQLDELFVNLNDQTEHIPSNWNKLYGKKVFLWATDHGMNEYFPIDAVSIDLYIKDIIEYFVQHPELGLIIRFHPYLIREMLQSGVFWSSVDFRYFVDFCNKSPNVVWDDTPNYCDAFKICDAMIIDVNCGFTVSFLTTHKPICRLLRNDIQVRLIHPELKDIYYYSSNIAELETFIQNVILGKDPLKKQREEAFHSSFLHFDGRNGQRIKQFLDNIKKTNE